MQFLEPRAVLYKPLRAIGLPNRKDILAVRLWRIISSSDSAAACCCLSTCLPACLPACPSAVGPRGGEGKEKKRRMFGRKPLKKVRTFLYFCLFARFSIVISDVLSNTIWGKSQIYAVNILHKQNKKHFFVKSF
jgi:hypothetical protein